MTLSASDLKIYGCASPPENDVSVCGGAIDTTTRIVFDSSTLVNTLNDKVNVVSSLAEDTGTVTVTGRTTAMVLDSESLTLTGTTLVSGTHTFSEVLKIAATHHGTVTVTDNGTGTTIIAMESGVNTMRKPFYNVSFKTPSKILYDKFFIKNTNSTDALWDAWVFETANPSGKISFALASGANDGETIANRLTAPIYVTASGFSSAEKPVEFTHIYAGSGLGVWMKAILTGTEHTFKSTYSIQVSGTIIS